MSDCDFVRIFCSFAPPPPPTPSLLFNQWEQDKITVSLEIIFFIDFSFCSNNKSAREVKITWITANYAYFNSIWLGRIVIIHKMSVGSEHLINNSSMEWKCFVFKAFIISLLFLLMVVLQIIVHFVLHFIDFFSPLWQHIAFRKWDVKSNCTMCRKTFVCKLCGNIRQIKAFVFQRQLQWTWYLRCRYGGRDRLAVKIFPFYHLAECKEGPESWTRLWSNE